MLTLARALGSFVQWPSRQCRRILGGLNVSLPLGDLEAYGNWHAHDADLQLMMLRSPATADGLPDNLEAIDLEGLLKMARMQDFLRWIFMTLKAREIGRLVAIKLRAGGRIRPEVEDGAYARYFANFLAVLESSPGCVFIVGSRTVCMKPGELWWVRARAKLGVRNDGATDCIYLSFDVTAPGYTGALPA